MEMSCVTQSRMVLWDLDLAPRTVVKWLDEVYVDGVTAVDFARERVGVEEDAITNCCRWAGGTFGVEVLVVHLADSAGGTRSEERHHEIDIGTDEGRVLGEGTLVEDGLESFVIGVAKELVELTAADGALDLFFGEELGVLGGDEELSGGNSHSKWGHKMRWAGPDEVGLQGASTEMLGS